MLGSLISGLDAMRRIADTAANSGRRYRSGEPHTVIAEPGVAPEAAEETVEPSAPPITPSVDAAAEETESIAELASEIDAEIAEAHEAEAADATKDEAPLAVAKPDEQQTFPRSVPYPELVAGPRLAFSACLLGHEVRYNTGHCRAKSLMDLFKDTFQLIPVCPEMDIGLGTPRPTLRLVMDAPPGASEEVQENMSLEYVKGLKDIEDIAKHSRLYCPENKQDYTTLMNAYSKAKVDELRALGIDGFVLKKDSPTCGVSRVPLYETYKEGARKQRMASGTFAAMVLSQWPELPVAEEGWLCDDDARDNFVQQTLCHAKWRQLDDPLRNFHSVLSFHEAHKYVLMAQDPKTLKSLGRMLAQGPKHFRANNGGQQYYSSFFGAMKIMVGRGRHQNVLLHLCGMLRNEVDAEMYGSLLESIKDYQEGLVPLVVPVKLMNMVAKTAQREKNAAEPATDNASVITPAPGKEFKDGSEFVLESEYLRGAPRSMKLHTAISRRMESKLPEAFTNQS